MLTVWVYNALMGKATYGTGTIFKRGRIWYLSYYVDGQQVVRSSRSANVQDAKRLRDQILGKKSRGELGDAVTVIRWILSLNRLSQKWGPVQPG